MFPGLVPRVNDGDNRFVCKLAMALSTWITTARPAVVDMNDQISKLRESGLPTVLAMLITVMATNLQPAQRHGKEDHGRIDANG